MAMVIGMVMVIAMAMAIAMVMVMAIAMAIAMVMVIAMVMAGGLHKVHQLGVFVCAGMCV